MRFLKALILLCLLVNYMVFAQEPVPEPPATPTPPPQAQVQFSVYVWPTQGILMGDAKIAGVPRVFYKSPDGKNQSIHLMRNTATPLMPYTGQLPLVLYDLEEVWTPVPENAPIGTLPTVKLVEKPKINVKFPIDWNRVMVIVFPDKKAPDGTLMNMALPYDQNVLKPGMARIYNGSDIPLVIDFEDADNKKLALQPFKVIDFNPANLTKNAYSRIFIYGAGHKGKIEMIHTSKLFFQPDTTNYFFLYSQGNGRIRIMRIAGHPGSEEQTLPVSGMIDKK